MSEIYFLSFADSNLKMASNRLKREAINFRIFDHIMILNETNLPTDFYSKYSDILNKNTKGFGYWIWKPRICLDVLNKMNEGDILIYSDVGTHLNIKGAKFLRRLLHLLPHLDFSMIASQIPIVDYADYKYTKGDVLDYFEVRNRNDIIRTGMVQAGLFIVQKNSKTLEFFENWNKVYEKEISLFDDSVSLSRSEDGFVSHRHDQSIFSILAKLNGVCLLPEFLFTVNNNDWTTLDFSPFWIMRDKDGVFKKQTIFSKIKKKLFSKIKKSFFLK